jgi:ERCC4-related helicase
MESPEYQRLREMFHKGAGKQMHPKLAKLAEILQTFFKEREGKAIVFTQLRISAK